VYSSCGRYFASISGGKYLRLNSVDNKDASTKRVTLDQKIKYVSYLMLSHSAKYLIAVDSFKYLIFEVATGKFLGSREEYKTFPKYNKRIFYGFINSTTLIGADGIVSLFIFRL
jgi:hypothetical protein